MAVPRRRLVRVQEKGQVTLPADLRRKLGLKKGDLVSVVQTDEGVLITPQEVITMKALDKLGAMLKEKGITLEELMDSGRELRGQIVEEKYSLVEEND